MGSHTSRWAAVNALYYEWTGDGQAREDGFRSLNYATYFAGEDGRISCCGLGFNGPYWFSDGYADYLRHFNWVMASIPDLAPVGQDHLLRSSSVVQQVSYAPREVRYRTFDRQGTEVLRLSFRPAAREGVVVEALAGGDFVVRVRREGTREAVLRGE